MTIQLQFVRQADFASEAIAWFTQGNFSHVDAVLPNGELLGARHDSVGGKPPGVQLRPEDYAEWALQVRFTIPCTGDVASHFYNFLLGQIGKPYDMSVIYGFITGRNWRQRDSWICSELQAAAMEHAGIVRPLYLSASKIAPSALALVSSVIASGRTVLAGADEFAPGYAT